MGAFPKWTKGIGRRIAPILNDARWNHRTFNQALGRMTFDSSSIDS